MGIKLSASKEKASSVLSTVAHGPPGTRTDREVGCIAANADEAHCFQHQVAHTQDNPVLYLYLTDKRTSTLTRPHLCKGCHGNSVLCATSFSASARDKDKDKDETDLDPASGGFTQSFLSNLAAVTVALLWTPPSFSDLA